MDFNDIKNKASEFFENSKDAIKDGVDKAGDFIDEKTDGKHKDQVDAVQGAVNGALGDSDKGDAEAAPEAPAAPEGEQAPAPEAPAAPEGDQAPAPEAPAAPEGDQAPQQ